MSQQIGNAAIRRLRVLAVPLCLALLLLGVLGAAMIGPRVVGTVAAEDPSQTSRAALVTLRADLAGLVAGLALNGGLPAEQSATVVGKFDAVWSGLQILAAAPEHADLRQVDAEVGVLAALSSILTTHEAALTSPASLDPRQSLELAQQLSGQLQAVESLATAFASRQGSAASGMSEGVDLVMLATLLAMVLAAVLLAQAMTGGLGRRGSAELFSGDGTGEARSKFLAMVSHELRTPMNGIIGLIALARQTNLTEPQDRLLEQAQRTGTDMSGLLNDIIDLSNLEADRMKLDAAPFRLDDLAADVDAALDPFMTRMGRKLNVILPTADQGWISGDRLRLQQTIVHLCRFAGTGGSDGPLTLKLGFRDDLLRVDLDCTGPLRMDALGRPVGFLSLPGASSELGESRASALGMVIARRLVALMKGQITASRLRSDRNRISIEVPAIAATPRLDRVRIDAQSETGEAVLRAMVADGPLELWDPGGSGGAVAAVLIEVPAPDLPARLRRLRHLHRGARLIAVGRPDDPGGFDVVCEDVSDAEAIRAALDRPDPAIPVGGEQSELPRH